MVRQTPEPGRIALTVLVHFAPASATMEQYDETVLRLKVAGDLPADLLEFDVCVCSNGDVRLSRKLGVVGAFLRIWHSRPSHDDSR